MFAGRALTGLWTGGKQSVEQACMAARTPKELLTEYTADLGTAACYRVHVWPTDWCSVHALCLFRSVIGLQLISSLAQGYFLSLFALLACGQSLEVAALCTRLQPSEDFTA